MCSAALAAVIARTSVGFSLSLERTVAMTCVSFLIALGEERPTGSVHEARREDLVVALAPLALEEAARDLARGERLLDVVAGEREKVDSRGARRR
jgi:hypothetical protein